MTKPKPKRPLNNVEFVTRLMDNGPALSQLVILEAIGRYAKDVVEHFDPNSPPPQWPGIINPHAWLEAAQDIHTKIENRGKEEN